jgi:hypothetical protein
VEEVGAHHVQRDERRSDRTPRIARHLPTLFRTHVSHVSSDVVRGESTQIAPFPYLVAGPYVLAVLVATVFVAYS